MIAVSLANTKKKNNQRRKLERERERRSGERARARARARGNYVRAHGELISARVLLQVSGNLTSRDVNT